MTTDTTNPLACPTHVLGLQNPNIKTSSISHSFIPSLLSAVKDSKHKVTSATPKKPAPQNALSPTMPLKILISGSGIAASVLSRTLLHALPVTSITIVENPLPSA